MPSRTVLVVDDDESIREVMALALEVYAGWTVVAADGGPAAIELARAQPPDAILMDFMMPGMDGITTFGHLQACETTRSIPVILVTAKSQVGPSQPWDGAAICGVIAKPFDARTLASRAAELLHWDHDAGVVTRRRN